MQEILNVKVILDDVFEVKGNTKDVSMILFHGEAHSEYFDGVILPGGVDTQIGDRKSERVLSARYILKGKDNHQKDCHIFIQNEGKVEAESDCIYTTPSIVTDSEILKWMEEVPLWGTVHGEEDCIRILIYKGERA